MNDASDDREAEACSATFSLGEVWLEYRLAVFCGNEAATVENRKFDQALLCGCLDRYDAFGGSGLHSVVNQIAERPRQAAVIGKHSQRTWAGDFCAQINSLPNSGSIGKGLLKDGQEINGLEVELHGPARIHDVADHSFDGSREHFDVVAQLRNFRGRIERRVLGHLCQGDAEHGEWPSDIMSKYLRCVRNCGDPSVLEIAIEIGFDLSPDSPHQGYASCEKKGPNAQGGKQGVLRQCLETNVRKRLSYVF
jgi:hypothetical protein